MGRKKAIKKDETVEGMCFVCKDGGTLRVCDYKNCLKVYHPDCVEKDDTFLESEIPWTCDWHSCFICKKTAKFNCFCCPIAVCGRCLCDADIAIVKMNGGLCSNCSKLARIIEGIQNPDSDEEKVDLNLEDSYEFLFKGYWEYVKEKEGLSSEHVRHANYLLSSDRNYDSDLSYACDERREEGGSDFEDQLIMTDNLDNVKEQKATCKRKRNKREPCTIKRKAKSKIKEFLGWGSKPLLEFLTSIGKDTIKELSQLDVANVISGYCRDNNLFYSTKKKKIVCDEKLRSLLRRKFVNKSSIYKLLADHFAGNFRESDDESASFGYRSDAEDSSVLIPCKMQRNSSSNGKCQNKEVVPDIQRSCFASVIARNIKLVYLRRSLLEELSKQPESFDSIVTGSFVRVKTDPYDWLQKNSHQLMQVTGITKTSINGEMNSDIRLQLSNRPLEVQICKLSNDDFTAEECEDLSQRVKDGLLRRPTVMEFEEKARNLHEVITKDWIARELAALTNLINRANEKGWRREFSEYMDRKLLLETPAEQSRLLHELPEVIADEVEVQTSCKDISRKDRKNSMPKSVIGGSLEPTKSSSCFLDAEENVAGDKDTASENSASEPIRSPVNKDDESRKYLRENIEKEKKEENMQYEAAAFEELQQESHNMSKEDKDNIIQTKGNECSAEGNKHFHEALLPGISAGQIPTPISQGLPGASLQEEQPKPRKISTEEQNENIDNAHKEEEQSMPRIDLTECSGRGFELVVLCDGEEQEGNKNFHKALLPGISAGQIPTHISQGLPGDSLKEQQPKPRTATSIEEQNEKFDAAHKDEEQSMPRIDLTECSERGFVLVVLSDDEKQDAHVVTNNLAVKKPHEGAAPEAHQQSHLDAHDTQDGGILQLGRNECCQAKQTKTGAFHPEPFSGQALASTSKGKTKVVPGDQQCQIGNATSKKKQNREEGVAHESQKQSVHPTAEFIVLSDDEEENASAGASQIHEDLNRSVWYCITPLGIKTGPYSMILLKEWSDSNSFELKWKVWKAGQSQEEAIFLTDALRQVFHGN